jgi:hypothetical protein
MKTNAICRRGMTAIEVLAATMLAALMLGAVAGILGVLTRQERDVRTTDSNPPWQEQLADRLQWDLQNSRQFIASRDGVRMEGFAARDFVTAMPTGQKAVVEYFLVDSKDERWLVRREEHPDDHTNDASRVELACRGINHMKWGESLIDQVAGAAVGPNRPARVELGSIPESVSIQLYRTESAAALFEKVLYR